MTYINMNTSAGVETIDEFESAKEARKMLREYQLAFHSCPVYLSQRCTQDWRDHVTVEHQEHTFVRALPAYRPEVIEPGLDEGMAMGGDAYNDAMFGDSPDW